MPHDKNRTIRPCGSCTEQKDIRAAMQSPGSVQKAKITGKTNYRSTYGVEFEQKTEVNKGNRKKIPNSEKAGKKVKVVIIHKTKRKRVYPV